MACAYFVILAIKRNDPRYWIWFGVFAGIGLEEKYSIAIFGAGIVAGVVLTEQRRVLLNRWIWLGGIAAFLIFLPNLLWNINHHWPFLELMHNIRAEGRDVVLGPVEFFLQQVLVVNPILAPLWITGLLALLFSKCLRPYRVLGWSYVVTYAAFFVLHGKNYYLTPIYPMLIAAGAVLFERWLDHPDTARPHLQWLKPVVVVILLAVGIHLAPIVIPVFSPERFQAYAKTLPFKLPVSEYSHAGAALPQWYADQFGWKEIADEAEVAWNRIPADERADCAIFGQDYGQAGAIDFFGRSHGLPGAISGDRTYFLWGPRGYSGKCMIILGDRKERLQELFDQVEFVGLSADNQWALETNISVNICRRPKFGTLSQLWPQLKHWR
jgi:hypothetical protein